MEASGTSGMKVIPNGGLNLSILDGWWCEGYKSDTGWAIGAGEDYDNVEYQDEVESKALYDVLENNVVPLFYGRVGDSLPRGWIAMMKSSMRKLGPVFSTNRMVKEYTERFYMRARDNWDKLSADSFQRARGLVEWKQSVEAGWNQVEITGAHIESAGAEVGVALKVQASIRLGSLRPDDVVVQIYSGPLDYEQNIQEGTTESMKCVGSEEDGLFKYEGYVACDESGLFGYSIRLLPHHPDLVDSFSLGKMRWIGDRMHQSAGRQQHHGEKVGAF